MKIYLVGGCVRDKFLGIKSKDKDYLVINSSVNEMLELGFIPVGKDFPVFLHPHTKEEYALARTERKISLGYKGFSFYASKDLTLKDDLKRRDLTINALAEDANGNIYDFFGGIEDIHNRVLKHVSEKFLEDPLRVLRIARFKAVLSKFNFFVDNQTISLISQIPSDEFLSLSADRVIVEMKKAFLSDNPIDFFDFLIFSKAFDVLFPELFKNFQFYRGDIISSFNNTKKFNFKQKLILIFLSSKISLSDFIQFSKRYNFQKDLIYQYKNIQENYNFLINLKDLKYKDILNLLKKFDFFRRPHFLLESLEILKSPYAYIFNNLRFTNSKDEFQFLSKEEILRRIDINRKETIEKFMEIYF